MVGSFKGLKLRSTKVEICAFRHVAVEVRPGNVSPCVCYREILRTALRIFAKLGQKSKGDELGTVTRPDFPGKILLINYS